MISKPLNIGTSANMPDYSSFVRQNARALEGGFANILAAAPESARQNSGDVGMLYRGKLQEEEILPLLTNPALAQEAKPALMHSLSASSANASTGVTGSASPALSMSSMLAGLNQPVRSKETESSSMQLPVRVANSRMEIRMASPSQQLQAGTQRTGTTKADTALVDVPSEALKTMEATKALSGGGIMLDQRSLGTLQRLSQSQDPATAPLASAAHHKTSATKHPSRSDKVGDSETTLELGILSAQYESGKDGVAAIGYDRNGGTSYGKYQISSRQGSFTAFVNYLDKEAPDIAHELRKGGNANTGGKNGTMPKIWRNIAQEQPERFEALQAGFIEASHYSPVESKVQDLVGSDLSDSMRQVIWSTAVHHGTRGAERIFNRAVEQVKKETKGDTIDEQALIKKVYSLRKGQFSSSTAEVQMAVRQRLDSESRTALAMLKEERSTLA